MKRLAILNDLHFGVSRVAGTTVGSRETLRDSLFRKIEDAMGGVNCDLLLAGDIFDKFAVDNTTFLDVYDIMTKWLRGSGTSRLILMAGNHDWSDRGEATSSFETLVRMLMHSPWGARVTCVTPNSTLRLEMEPESEFDGTPGVVFMVSHHSDQEKFVGALATLKKDAQPYHDASKPVYVVLHANYSNKFAARSDHSLNISEEMAKELTPATLIFAHEHQQKKAMGGKVQVIGNQWPTSIADCQGNDTKRFAVVTTSGVEYVNTWEASDPQWGYVTIDWRQLDDWTTFTGFVEVVGDAESNQSADVVAAVAKFRVKSKALVVTQSVNIAGVVREDGDLSDLRVGKKFNVREFAAGILKPRQMETFDYLSKENGQ